MTLLSPRLPTCALSAPPFTPPSLHHPLYTTLYTTLSTPPALRAALLSSVDRVPALEGRMVSGGRLNVAAALAALLGAPAPYHSPISCERLRRLDTALGGLLGSAARVWCARQ